MPNTFSSISEIHAAYRGGRATVKEVVLACLTRIAEIDACEGGLKSVIEVNPDALKIAEQMQPHDSMPPLFGIPILLKDNVNTFDRMHTTAGSVALADNYAPYDADITTLLRQAGAVIIGKANMTEFANYMTSGAMPSGYSSRGGQVLHPHDVAVNPSGSSSGSAVAVAAGLCTVSIGTETSGSIISPAGVCGVVGLKPTAGLVSGHGIIPISSTFDTAGPMSRNVRDTAVLLGVLAGQDYTNVLENCALKGVRVGINKSIEKDENFDKLCQLLSSAGAIIVDDITVEGDFRQFRRDIMRYEFKGCLNHYLSTVNTKVRNLGDIVEFNQANAHVALKYGQDILLDAQNTTTGNFTEAAYLEALLYREKMIGAFDAVFANCDILLGDSFVYNAPAVGFPTITIPVKQFNTRAAFTAQKYNEVLLLKIGSALERQLCE